MSKEKQTSRHFGGEAVLRLYVYLLSITVYAVAAAVYKLYPFYIIMYDIGISFTFTFILSANCTEKGGPAPACANRASK